MRVVDANVLIYAVEAESPFHEASHRWLSDALFSSEITIIPWVSVLTLVRIATDPRIYDDPWSASDLMREVDWWLRTPSVLKHPPVDPSPALVAEMIEHKHGRGSHVNDAFLAAVAKTNEADVVSFDGDFAHYPGIRWVRPD